MLVLIKVYLASPTKVTDFDHLLFVYQKIFWLKIPMNEAMFMHEINSSHSLNEIPKCVSFIEAFIFRNSLEQVLFLNIFHDKVEMFAILQVGIEAHNVYMLELLVNFNLPLKRLEHLRLHQAFF